MCWRLQTVKFGEGLETLGTDEYESNGVAWTGVFEESAVETVELPRTLKRIKCSAFNSCKNLKTI